MTESAAQRQPAFGIMTLVQCIGPNIGIDLRKARCMDSKCYSVLRTSNWNARRSNGNTKRMRVAIAVSP
ncbi:MAG: hypothetical protein EOR57_26630 [Mesorhizobium sp.]|nr:MAG: hypothetical protein EOR57_26630 [Mesorhizobium sp.]